MTRDRVYRFHSLLSKIWWGFRISGRELVTVPDSRQSRAVHLPVFPPLCLPEQKLNISRPRVF